MNIRRICAYPPASWEFQQRRQAGREHDKAVGRVRKHQAKQEDIAGRHDRRRVDLSLSGRPKAATTPSKEAGTVLLASSTEARPPPRVRQLQGQCELFRKLPGEICRCPLGHIARHQEGLLRLKKASQKLILLQTHPVIIRRKLQLLPAFREGRICSSRASFFSFRDSSSLASSSCRAAGRVPSVREGLAKPSVRRASSSRLRPPSLPG